MSSSVARPELGRRAAAVRRSRLGREPLGARALQSCSRADEARRVASTSPSYPRGARPHGASSFASASSGATRRARSRSPQRSRSRCCSTGRALAGCVVLAVASASADLHARKPAARVWFNAAQYVLRWRPRRSSWPSSTGPRSGPWSRSSRPAAKHGVRGDLLLRRQQRPRRDRHRARPRLLGDVVVRAQDFAFVAASTGLALGLAPIAVLAAQSRPPSSSHAAAAAHLQVSPVGARAIDFFDEHASPCNCAPTCPTPVLRRAASPAAPGLGGDRHRRCC